MKLMSRIFPREKNTPDANRLDTRIDARSVLVDKSRSNSGSASRVVAIFLSRRNESSRSSHSLSAREEASEDNDVERSDLASEKSTGNKGKLSSENTTQISTANAGFQKKPSEKANSDDQEENGAKSAVENGKSLGNTDKLVSGSQKTSSSTGSLDSEAQKSSNNAVGLVSDGQKSSIGTASSDPKVQVNPSDAGKSTTNGLTNGTNGTPEAQKDKNKNQNADVPKEKSEEKADPNKSAQGKSSTPSADSKKGKDDSDEEGKNAASPSSAPKSVSPSPVIPQDDKDTGPEGVNTEKNNLQTGDKSAQNQASSPENAKLTEKLDPNETKHSSSSGTDLPLDNSNLEVAPIPNKDSSEKNSKEAVSSSSLTSSAKASLDSNDPKISATQSTKNDSHSDVVKLLASIFGALLLLTIITYVIRLFLRHRRLGKAESPPQSPLLNQTEPISRGFPNNMTNNRDFSNSHNFYPFQEEERLRTMEMNKTYGRVV